MYVYVNGLMLTYKELTEAGIYLFLSFVLCTRDCAWSVDI